MNQKLSAFIPWVTFETTRLEVICRSLLYIYSTVRVNTVQVVISFFMYVRALDTEACRHSCKREVWTSKLLLPAVQYTYGSSSWPDQRHPVFQQVPLIALSFTWLPSLLHPSYHTGREKKGVEGEETRGEGEGNH